MAELLQPAIISVIVSASVAIAILLWREYKIEPHRWRKNVQVTHLQKRLEVYGTLITLLESCRVKAMRQSKASPEEQEKMYLMENPFDTDKFQEIFERSNYLLSHELRQEWIKAVREDEYFSMFDAKKKGHAALLVNFKQMHELAMKEFDTLKGEYKTLTGLDLPKGSS